MLNSNFSSFKLFLYLWIRAGIFLITGLLFVFLSFRYNWFNTLDFMIYDLGLAARSHNGDETDIRIVSIDRYSRDLAFSQPHFPVSRHLEEHSMVIGRLAQAGAKAVVVDILFDQIDPEASLDPFLNALRQVKNIILTGFIEKQDLTIGSEGIVIEEERMIRPSRRIPSHIYNIGLVNAPVDRDQTVRQFSGHRVFQGIRYDTLPLALVKMLSVKAKNRPKGGDAFFIDYTFPKNGFPIISYVDLLKKKGWENHVRNKIVFIGVTENGIRDSYSAPISVHQGKAHSQQVPGVLVLAYATQTLLSDHTISWLTSYASLPMSVVIICLCCWVTLRRRLMFTLLSVFTLIIVIAIGGIILISMYIAILPAGKWIAAVMVSTMAGILLNYVHTKVEWHHQAKELKDISFDLKSAQKIQTKLQPGQNFQHEAFEISGMQIPCKEIGGDYYDIIKLDDQKTAILIADVSGKGISGALVMSNLQSTVHSLAGKIFSPSKLMHELNKNMTKFLSEKKFVTFFYGLLDLNEKTFLYCNAGHLPPILCQANGQLRFLLEGGPFLGAFSDIKWKESQTRIKSGDLFFFYTDGLKEATPKRGEDQFGQKRIVKHIIDQKSLKPELINKHMMKALKNFTNSKRYEDDITVLTLKIS